MGNSILDGENLSEEVIVKMSFELKERINYIRMVRKSIPSRGSARARAFKKERAQQVHGTGRTQCGWSIVSKEEIRILNTKYGLDHIETYRP